MTIQNIITTLLTATEFKQVVESGSSANTPIIDTEALLNNLLSSAINNVYALTLPEQAAYPNIVYMLVGGKNNYFEKHLLTQVDSFIISLRATTLDLLASAASTLLTAIIASPYAIEITDKQKDFEPERECFRLDLELSFSVPATGANAETPALIVYHLGEDGEESDYDNLIKQKITSGYGIAILTTANDMEALRQAVQGKLLGYQQTPQHYEMQFARGAPLENEGGLRIWRDIYQDSYSIQQN